MSVPVYFGSQCSIDSSRAWINNLCRCATYNPGGGGGYCRVGLRPWVGDIANDWCLSLCISVHSAPLIILGPGYIITHP